MLHSVVELKILAHYYASHEQYEVANGIDGIAFDQLCEADMLWIDQAHEAHITDRGRVHIQKIMQLMLPEQNWVSKGVFRDRQ